MSDFSHVDVNGLSGALSYGMSQAGGDLLYRTGYLTLGRSMVKANEHLWGGVQDFIDKTLADKAEDWYHDGRMANVVTAVPPCSWASVLTGKGHNRGLKGAAIRGVDHPMVACVHSSAQYAARHKPDVYMFESVIGAFKIGQDMLRGLRDEIEMLSGEQYTLTHWLHDTCVLGGPTSRQRYLFVITKGDRPFAVTPYQEYEPEHFTPLSDAIADIELQKPHPGWQNIKRISKAGDFAKALWNSLRQVDGNYGKETGGWWSQRNALMEEGRKYGVPWREGYAVNELLPELHAAAGDEVIINIMGPKAGPRLISNGFNTGPFTTRREVWSGLCALIAGDGPEGHIHPRQDRTLTFRECARVQGWPDSLSIDYDTKVYGRENLLAVWGKAVTATVARHAGREVASWLQGDTGGKTTGELVGDREWVIDELEPSRRLRREATAAKKAAKAAALENSAA